MPFETFTWIGPTGIHIRPETYTIDTSTINESFRWKYIDASNYCAGAYGGKQAEDGIINTTEVRRRLEDNLEQLKAEYDTARYMYDDVDKIINAEKKYLLKKMELQNYDKARETDITETLKEPMHELVFLYGTLRQGNRHHYLLLPEKKFIYKTVIEGFQLIEIAKGFPAIIPMDDRYVWGELWNVSKENLALLNNIEKAKTKGTVKFETSKGKGYATTWFIEKDYDKKKILSGYTDWDSTVDKLSLINGVA